MCLIIDSNFVHHVHPSPDEDGRPIRQALLDGKARLVYGGKLGQEYLDGSGEFRRWLVLLDQAGRARRVPDDAVNHATQALIDGGACVSNDQHIIALAQVGAVRLVCSSDGALHADFTNNALLVPRGSVYQRAEHTHLIALHCSKVAQPSHRKGQRKRRRRRPK